MSRRIRWQMLIALAGSLIVLLLFGRLALSTAATSLPFYRSAYVEGVVGVPMQLNPLLGSSTSPQSEQDLEALIFDGLTRPGPDGYPQPVLAERWSVDAATTVFTFTLRSGLRWHDGIPFTADDVIFTVRSVQQREFAGDPSLAELWRNVLVERLDDHRIRFTLRQPFAPFLAATSLPILPRHLLEHIPVEQWPAASFSRHPIGTGPFRLHSLDESEAILRPFEGAARGRPRLDLLVLRFYPSHDAALAALRRGDVQGVAVLPVPGTASRAAPDLPDAHQLPLANYTMLTFNLREAPLDDVRLRTALTEALDREELIRSVLGTNARRIDTPIVPQLWAHSPATLPAPAGQRAAEMLDAAGWRSGPDGLRSRDEQPLRLDLVVADIPDQRAVVDEIAHQWRLVGIDVRIEALAQQELHERLRGHAFTVALHSWTDLGADPDAFALWHSSQAERGANVSGLADARIDRLLQAGRATADRDRRAQIYREFEQRWVTLVPSLPLYQQVLLYHLQAGVRPAGLDADHLWEQPAARFRKIEEWLVESLP